MAKNRRERKARLRVLVELNPQEAVSVYRLMDSGLYGLTLGQTVRRLMDERLFQLLARKQEARGHS